MAEISERVRRGEASDLDVIIGFLASARQEFVSIRGRTFELDSWAEPAEESVADALTSPEWGFFLATYGDVAVGYAAVTTWKAPPQAAEPRIGRVHDVFVDEGFRELGFGEALLGACQRWLISHGVASADMLVSPGHRAAKNLCEQNGFKARSLIMHSQDLGANQWADDLLAD